MSILAAAAAVSVPATAPAPVAITAGNVLFCGLMLALGVGAASALGAFRPNSVDGPIRLAPQTRAARVLLLLGGGVVVWFGMQVIYGVVVMVQHKLSGNPEPFRAESLGPKDYAILATVPYLIALFFLLLGARVAKPTLLRELGWSRDRFGIGVAIGLLASVSVIPLMMGSGGALEMVYHVVGYQHPSEHELLKVLGESQDRLSTILIIIGATLMAPLFEEFLFRGLLQTLLVRAFTPRPRAIAAPVAQPVAVGEAIEGGSLVSPPPLPLPEADVAPPPVPSAAARWGAIAITSFLFAIMHPSWTWPLIFLLALALGYAYERTANLWVPVTMHLVFNTTQTVFFLFLRSL